MQLLCALWFFVAHFDISIAIKHIAGTQNTAADQLSRFDMQPFSLSNPQASWLPTPLPMELLQIVCVQPGLDITSIHTAVQHYYQEGQKRYPAF